MALAAIALAGASAPAADAAAPTNDAFAAAELITGSTASVAGTNVEATKETGEPSHRGYSGTHSVWYRWVAPSSGTVTLTSSAYYRVVAVYTGVTVDGLTPVAAVPNAPSDADQFRFRAVEGRAYSIAIDSRYSEDYYVGKFTLKLALISAPANDDFSAATVLTGTEAQASADNSGATLEAGERYGPDSSNYDYYSAGRTLWYSWTAPSTGAATIDTVESAVNTTLGVYTGDTPSGLVRVATNDDAPGLSKGASRVTFRAVAGTTYRIQLDTRNYVFGAVRLWLKLGPLPANDAFASAVDLGAADTAGASGDNGGASVETGEPMHYPCSYYCAAQSSVWYRWTAPRAGSLTIRANAAFQTVLAAYTGDAVGGLTRVTNQPQDYNGGSEQIRIRVEAGVTYYLAVDSRYADVGSFSLALNLVDSPANDDFAKPSVLAGLSVDVDGTNVAATQEPCEPVHENNYYDPSVWYSWTAPVTGGVTIDMSGTLTQSLVGVYTGDSLCALVRVGITRSGSKRRFRAIAGVTYRIAVDGANAKQNPFHLALREVTPPANDMFAAAEPIAGSSATVAGNTIGATGEDGEPNPGGTAGASVWYSWTASATGRVKLSLPTSDFSPELTAYTGDSVGALKPVSRYGSSSSGYQFRAEAGTTYRITVHGGSAASRGEFSLSFGFTPSPPNDDFANAEVLTGQSASTTGTNVGATWETGEVGYYGYARASVWYRWTAPISGRVTLDLTGTGFYTDAAVYTGSSLTALTRIVATYGRKLSFKATAGETYRIAVDGDYYSDFGAIKLALTEVVIPPNDDFANAEVLKGSIADASGTNAGAGTESYEPSYVPDDYDYKAGSSVWYRWRAPADGPVTVDTLGSNFDTVLGVYTGATLSARTSVAGNNNVDGGKQSRVTFQAKRGTVYRIVVDAYEYASPATGNVALHLRHATPPANDAFVNAELLTGTSVDAVGTSAGATREKGEPVHAGNGGGASVWYRWTAPEDGSLDVSTAGSDFDTLLGVYTGTAVDGLKEIGSNHDFGGLLTSFVTVPVSGGVEYLIAVDGRADAEGPVEGAVKLGLDFTPAPPQDAGAKQQAVQADGPGGPPADNPPAQGPPAQDPPADDPPADDPPADDPPADDPPADDPPADDPPADDPPADDPPAVNDPPAGDPPTTETPTTELPADNPVANDPPADDPPADDPTAADDPPADDPPADDTSGQTGTGVTGDLPAEQPADDPPADDPPSDDPPADDSVDQPDQGAGAGGVTGDVPDDPPVNDTPPTDDPPADDPIAQDPPADDPPADDPPADDPPKDDPPSGDPSKNDPPSTEPKTPPTTTTGKTTAPAKLRVTTSFASKRISEVLLNGVVFTPTCNRACYVRVGVVLDRSTKRYGLAKSRLGREIVHATVPGGKQARIGLRLTKAERKKLRAAKSLKLTLNLLARSGNETASGTTRVTLGR